MNRKMKAIHPGIILLEEVITPNNLTVEQVANRMNVQLDDLFSITIGQSPITKLIADKISNSFGGSSELWLRLQNAFNQDQQSM